MKHGYDIEFDVPISDMDTPWTRLDATSNRPTWWWRLGFGRGTEGGEGGGERGRVVLELMAAIMEGWAW